MADIFDRITQKQSYQDIFDRVAGTVVAEAPVGNQGQELTSDDSTVSAQQWTREQEAIKRYSIQANSTPEEWWLYRMGYPQEFISLLKPQPEGRIKNNFGLLADMQMPEQAISDDPREWAKLKRNDFVLSTTFANNLAGLPDSNPLKQKANRIIALQNQLAKQMKTKLPSRRKYKNFWDELGRSLAAGSMNVAVGGLSAVAEASDNAIWDRQQVEDLAEKIYLKSREQAWQPGESGGVKGFIAQAIGQALPYMAASTAATLFTGTPVSGFAVGYAVEGELAKREALEAGASMEDAEMNKFIVGTINGAIESLQVSQVLQFGSAGKEGIRALVAAARQKAWSKIAKIGKDLTYRQLETALQEALEEALQETTSVVAQERVAPGQISGKEAATRIGGAALGGAVAGPVLGAGGAILGTTGKKQVTTDIAKVQVEPSTSASTPTPKRPVDAIGAAQKQPAETQTQTESIQTTPGRKIGDQEATGPTESKPTIAEQHKAAVEKLWREGKPVNQRYREMYPDLVEKYEKKEGVVKEEKIIAPAKTEQAKESDEAKRLDEADIARYEAANPDFVVNIDRAKLTFEGYNTADIANENKFYGKGAELAGAVYEKWLKERKGTGDNVVVFTAGGTGSGKSTATGDRRGASIIVDSTLSSKDWAVYQIDRALEEGYDVEIVYVYRDPVDAWENGIWRRYESGGHFVPAANFLNTHVKSKENILEIAAKYGDRVSIQVYENKTGKEPQRISLDELRNKTYNLEEVKEQINAISRQKIKQHPNLEGSPEAFSEPADGRGGDEGAERSKQEVSPRAETEAGEKELGPAVDKKPDSAEGEKPPAESGIISKEVANEQEKVDNARPGRVWKDGVQPLEDVPSETVQAPQATGGAVRAPEGSRESGRGVYGAGTETGSGLPRVDGDSEGDVDHSARRGGREPARDVDYRITDTDQIGSGGAKTKFRNNVRAIKLLRRIESENRKATPEEQAILVKYVGWGGMPQAFDVYNEKWQKEAAELRDLLDRAEYSSARASTPNAHYTSPAIIKSLWEGLKGLGFKGGKINEPSMGTGLFYGLIPEDIIANSELYGGELDSISGRIAQQLYQSAKIQIKGFEKTQYPDDFFDLFISNVPFGDYKIHDDELRKINFNIHDYFFAKALKKTRPGGLIAFITSKGSLDKTNSLARRYMARYGNLVGAIRLPKDTFKGIANTEVVTDILIFQKRDPKKFYAGEKFEAVTKVEQDGKKYTINEYFAKHPDHILGKLSYAGSMYRADEMTVEPSKKIDVPTRVQEIIAGLTLPEALNTAQDVRNAERYDASYSAPAPDHIKQNAFVVKDNRLLKKQGEELVAVNVGKATEQRIKKLIMVRNATRDLLYKQLDPDATDAQVEAARKKLNVIYDSVTKKYGPLSSPYNQRVFKDDPDLWYYLMILVKPYCVYKHQRLIPARCYAARPSPDAEGR